MRIAYFSDTHVEHRPAVEAALREGDLDPFLAILGSPERIEADLLVNAGDTHFDAGQRVVEVA